jgi:mannose-1-phosphate guanylyltransferase
MVLAAGMGVRLRPLTDNSPKCLMPLAGRPLIDWTLRWLKSVGVTACLMNLHYLPDKVRNFLGNGESYGLRVDYSYEKELLGTAGAIKKVADFFTEPFYTIYADNFSLWDLRKLKIAYELKNPVATVAVHWREDVNQSGMVELDADDWILRLVEKPKTEDVASHYVNAGFYYLNPRVLDYIPEGKFSDFGHHIFPKMLQAGEKIYAVKMEDPIIGIDTLEAYEKANAYALSLRKQE